MKVAGNPFLMTIAKHILDLDQQANWITQKKDHILKRFKALIGAYVTRGLRSPA